MPLEAALFDLPGIRTGSEEFYEQYALKAAEAFGGIFRDFRDLNLDGKEVPSLILAQ